MRVCERRVKSLCAPRAAAGPSCPWRQLRGSRWTDRRETAPHVQEPSVRPRPGWQHIFSSQSWCDADLWGRARGLNHQKSAENKGGGGVFTHTHAHTTLGAADQTCAFETRETWVDSFIHSMSSGLTLRCGDGECLLRCACVFSLCLANLFSYSSSSDLHPPDPLKWALCRTTQLVLRHTDCNSCFCDSRRRQEIYIRMYLTHILYGHTLRSVCVCERCRTRVRSNMHY